LPVSNPDFIASAYNWSGVGWDRANPERSIAMISPQHFVGANHWQIPVGNTISFLNNYGELKSYTVEGYSVLESTDKNVTHTADLVLGRLSAPIQQADNICYYSVPDADNAQTSWFDADWYIGKQIVSYGKTARAATNNIDSFAYASSWSNDESDNQTFSALFDFHKTDSASYPDEAGLEPGDSGSPSFMIWDGQITLVGTHFAINDTDPDIRINADSFVPYYISALNTAMDGSGYSVSAISVIPEPSGLFMILGGIIGFFLSRRRRTTHRS
jgi:hypothetical protein